MTETYRELAELIRSTCIQAALEAYEDAGVSGLCAEGRWEYTIGILRQLDLEPLLQAALQKRAEERPKSG